MAEYSVKHGSGQIRNPVMTLRCYILDVFADKSLMGNPLAVVTDAERLKATQMQAIAREFNLSETVFLLPPKSPAHTAAIRIFTPNHEIPFAGHPTLGAAVLLARLKNSGDDGPSTSLIMLEEGVGPVRAAVRMEPGEAPFAEFDAPRLPEDAGAPAPDDRIAAALGLAPSEIGFENHEVTRYSAGAPFTFVPVSGLEAIGRARIVHQYWKEAFRGDEFEAAYLYCRQTLHQRSAFHARAFAPLLGAPEDPATGSAAAAFSAVIHRFDALPEGTYRGLIEQGVEMGRPSEITLEMEIGGRVLRSVRVGGRAVVTAEVTLHV
jgi:trans-2,3-dihydro-3-hydroxyanthranilate isomerase